MCLSIVKIANLWPTSWPGTPKAPIFAAGTLASARLMEQLVDILMLSCRSSGPARRILQGRSFNKAIVDTVNNLLRPEALKSWQDMNSTEQTHAATMLLTLWRKGPSPASQPHGTALSKFLQTI
ncbi:adhesion G protein-coupled receptor L2 isoform X3 [Lates japonicus]|uniref:Adhesion G protein-coupled receptor L2 isoform X3 n=1 Tax=Lates japonicus TaxID=270547 RepID=A0AAD3R003_LATJO|nr:adhesion G protein-coupled receptor L2 isoform X3 [Lates japonicus]